MNVAENLLSQKCFVFRDSFEGKRYHIAETKFHELKIWVGQFLIGPVACVANDLDMQNKRKLNHSEI